MSHPWVRVNLVCSARSCYRGLQGVEPSPLTALCSSGGVDGIDLGGGRQCWEPYSFVPGEPVLHRPFSCIIALYLLSFARFAE